MWQPDPEHNSKTAWVFLAVDVVGHSKLVAAAQSNLKMREVHEILTYVQEWVWKTIPERRESFLWDWAGDGGIFAFPASNLDYRTTENALNCAVAIFESIDRMNVPYIVNRNEDNKIHLHITLGRGDAYYTVEPGIRRSDALNVVMKTKAPSQQTSILASQEILDDLPRERRLDFTSIRLDSPEKLVYAYAPATRQGLRNLAERHATDREPMEAAHCAYREAALCLAVGDPANAVEAFAKAIRWMDDTPEDVRHRYFWRTLKGFYEGWKLLLEEAPRSLSSRRWEDRREFLASDEARTFFSSSSTRAGIGNLLSHVEYILEQLDILAQKVVNEPAGLTTLEMCLLLQRCGYSCRYESHLINKRLERIRAEIAENHHRSIDGDCSLCTGAAASCLLLAGDTNRANDLLDWLASLKGVRYSCIEDGSTNEYGDIPFAEHALHYASVAMCGFADARRMADAESVKNILLGDECDQLNGSFPAHWMRYRNINEYEICGYILPALVRYELSGGTFKDHEKRRCADVLDTLAAAVIAEAQRAERPDRPERLYAARENIGTFALGMIQGIALSDRAEKLATRTFSAFKWRLQWIKTRPSVRRQTLDSVPDRARKFLSGWMLQWEMILRADSHTLPSYARELFEQPSATTQSALAPPEP